MNGKIFNLTSNNGDLSENSSCWMCAVFGQRQYKDFQTTHTYNRI